MNLRDIILKIARAGLSGRRLYTALLLACAACVSGSAAPARPAYTNFSIIPERNIFNTKRSPAYKPSNKPTRTGHSDYIALTGTMLDQRGAMAFFDGSQSEYRKVLKPNDAVAGFQIENIEHAYVKLKYGTNEMILPVNKQLTREEQGEWQLADRSESRTGEVAQSTSGASRDSGSSGRRDDRGDRRDRNRDRRSDRSSNSGSDNAPSPQAEQPVAKDATTGTNTNASAATPGSLPNDPEAILRILEERRRQEDQ